MAGKRTKTGTVIIDKSTHEKLSDHCRRQGLKIGYWVTKALEKALEAETTTTN